MKRTLAAVALAALAGSAVVTPALAQSYSYTERYEYRQTVTPRDRQADDDRYDSRYDSRYDQRVDRGYYGAPAPRYVAPRYAPQQYGSGYGYGDRYDDRTPCQVVKKQNSTAGLLIGALAGGVLGNNVGGRGAKSEAAAIGALAGAAIGSSLGRNSAKDGSVCQNEAYYGPGRPYQSGYTQPRGEDERGYGRPYSYERERYSYGH